MEAAEQVPSHHGTTLGVGTFVTGASVGALDEGVRAGALVGFTVGLRGVGGGVALDDAFGVGGGLPFATAAGVRGLEAAFGVGGGVAVVDEALSVGGGVTGGAA